MSWISLAEKDDFSFGFENHNKRICTLSKVYLSCAHTLLLKHSRNENEIKNIERLRYNEKRTDSANPECMIYLQIGLNVLAVTVYSLLFPDWYNENFEYYISIYFYMVQNINILDYSDNNIIIYHHILSGKRYKFFD